MNNDVVFYAKLDKLYKHIAEGWSVSISESMAGLNQVSCNEKYKKSEHYERVRKIAKGMKKDVNRNFN